MLGMVVAKSRSLSGAGMGKKLQELQKCLWYGVTESHQVSGGFGTQ